MNSITGLQGATPWYAVGTGLLNEAILLSKFRIEPGMEGTVSRHAVPLCSPMSSSTGNGPG